jgi:hypothetical protein
MMIRRFNYTGRERIRRADVSIRLIGEEPVRTFEAGLQLRDYELPPDAKVYVEAYEKAAFMRFDFGTVGSVSPPPEAKRKLHEFEGSDVVRFRVKVVDERDHSGKLLAEADGILPLVLEERERDRRPLLAVRSEDLGQQVWAISYPDSTQGMPVLSINSQVADRTALVRSPLFMSLVLPAIFREILTRILIYENHCEMDDEDWKSQWLQFAHRVLPTAGEPPEDRERAVEWIDGVVGEFCSKQKSFTQFLDSYGEVS